MKKFRFRIVWQGLVVSSILSLIFLHNFALNLHQAIEFSHGDAFHVSFTLKHFMNAALSGNWSEITTVPMFYGFKDSLFFSEAFIMQAIMALPIFLLTKNIILNPRPLSGRSRMTLLNWPRLKTWLCRPSGRMKNNMNSPI